MDITTIGMVVGISLAIVSPIISVTVNATIMKVKIDYLEKKMDKHNGLVERMVVVEQLCKSDHKRIDRLNDNKE